MRLLNAEQPYTLGNITKWLAIAAKEQDLDYSMTQLVAELITLDQWERTPEQPILLIAITTGKIWGFVQLDRANKQIDQGLESYRVPEDLEHLMRILIHALIHTQTA